MPRSRLRDHFARLEIEDDGFHTLGARIDANKKTHAEKRISASRQLHARGASWTSNLPRSLRSLPERVWPRPRRRSRLPLSPVTLFLSNRAPGKTRWSQSPSSNTRGNTGRR